MSEKTRAIVPVHHAGQPCDLEAITAIAASEGIHVIEDAAHALGAAYRGRPIGSHSDYTCFSFYATKNITTMEGGAVALHREDDAHRIRMLATHGMAASAFDRYAPGAESAPPQVIEPGFKYRMNNVGAAMGLAQLDKLPELMRRRRVLAARYRSLLAEIDEVSPLEVREGLTHAEHLMIVRVALDRLTVSRDEFATAMRNEGIGTGVHFLGLHLHEYYRDVCGWRPEDLPHATAASTSILSLPLYPTMEDDDVRHVIEALKKVVADAR